MGATSLGGQSRLAYLRDGRRVVEVGGDPQLGSETSHERRYLGDRQGSDPVERLDCYDVGSARRSCSVARSATSAERHVGCGVLVQMGVGLVTLNRRDFVDFAEHEGLVLLGEETR